MNLFSNWSPWEASTNDAIQKADNFYSDLQGIILKSMTVRMLTVQRLNSMSFTVISGKTSRIKYLNLSKN